MSFCNDSNNLVHCDDRNDPGAGNIITFAQFLVVALEGFVVTTKFLTVKNQVPIR